MDTFKSAIDRRAFLSSGTALGMGIAFSGGALNALAEKEKATLPNKAGEALVIGHGGFRYRVRKEWGNLDPVKTPVFNCHEMVMDSKGRLIMVTDEVKNNIIIYDKSGKLIDSWGSRFPGGHGLTLSVEGDEDFLFIVDCGWYFGKDGKWHKQAGSVSKMTVAGDLIFTIGHPQTIGAYEEGQKYMPTEVAVAPNGDFYVADGYGSDFILQYDHRGVFIRKFGGSGNANPDHDLQNAHGICVDLRDPNKPMLICTSRRENAFKYFTLDGQYIKTVKLPGAYVCRPVIRGKMLYSGVCWSQVNGKKPQDSGFVTILDEKDRVVSNPGGTAPLYENGTLQPMQTTFGIFNHCHDICVDEDENLYVCQWNANKTYPIKLERV